jgi:hypothetical protein
VHTAVEASVGLGGEAALGVFDDVVDVAAADGFFAAGVLAVPVAYLDGAAGGAGEEAAAYADVDDSAGGVEHDPFDVRVAQRNVTGSNRCSQAKNPKKSRRTGRPDRQMRLPAEWVRSMR